MLVINIKERTTSRLDAFFLQLMDGSAGSESRHLSVLLLIPGPLLRFQTIRTIFQPLQKSTDAKLKPSPDISDDISISHSVVELVHAAAPPTSQRLPVVSRSLTCVFTCMCVCMRVCLTVSSSPLCSHSPCIWL